MPRTVTVGTGTGEGDLVDKLGLSEAPGTRGLAGQGFWPGDLDSWPTVCKGAAGSGPRLGLRRAGLCRAWQWERALVSVGHRARVGGIGRCTRGRKCKGPVTGVGRLGLPRGDTPEHRPWPWRGLGWSVEPGRRPRPSPAQPSPGVGLGLVSLRASWPRVSCGSCPPWRLFRGPRAPPVWVGTAEWTGRRPCLSVLSQCFCHLGPAWGLGPGCEPPRARQA